MKLLSRLFKGEQLKGEQPAPPQPALDDKIQNLIAQGPEALVNAVQSADDGTLIAAAISELPDGDTLRRLGGIAAGGSSADPSPLLRAAQSRLAELIDSGAIATVDLDRQSSDRSALLCIFALCKDASHLSQALAAIDDPAQLAQLVTHSPSSRVRQQAAEMIDDPEQLRELLKQVRTKDKTAFKILKHKCDALNAAERQAAERAAEAIAICASLERHALRSVDAHYASTLEHLQGRWRALDAQPDAALDPRVAQAVERCRQVIAEHQRLAAQAEAKAAAEQAAQQAAAQARERELQEAAAAAAARAAEEAERQREAAALRDAEARVAADAQAAAEQALRQLGGLIGRARALLNDGNTQSAAGLRRAIDEKLAAAPSLPAHLARSLQQLDEKLNELRQWKDFAVAPKRAELIQEMESLIGASDEPTVLAERIKALQQDWKTVSKGIVVDPPEDWERFHRAAQTAFQPCREYFEAQAQLRQLNLAHRQALLQRLAAFEAAQDWEKPDWGLVARVLREAPLEWRRHFPVERQAGRAAQAEFDAATARLQTRLDGWHERNVADKQSLIKRARGVLALEDSREAVDAIKRLQAQWKEVGVAPREQEQALWREFREVCDAVFQKREQAYSEYAAGLESAKIQCIALCEEVEAAAKLAGAELAQANRKIPEWRSALAALGELPKADARALRDRFEQALSRCESAAAQQRERDASQSIANLFDAGRHLAAYGLSVARNADVSEQNALKQAAEDFIAGVPHWPKGGLQAVKDSLAKAASRSAADADAAEPALRLLCIRAEIHAEMPTPPEDEAMRRDHQVQRLMRSMGQGVSAQERDWDAMMLEWIRTGPVSTELYDGLLQRLLRCRPAAQPRAAQRR